MDFIFWVCVRLMVILAHLLHISYQQLNVLLFVVLHPSLTLCCYWRWQVYKKRYRASVSRIRNSEPEPS